MFAALMGSSRAQLSTDFYKKACPKVFAAVNSVVKSAVTKEKRMGASLLRLHFHDCFVQGCDASILLDDTSSFRGEQTITANNNSIRGMDVIDDIKAKVEAVCPDVVSCADILTIAARDSVVLLGGPSWTVKVGRRDSKSASFELANSGVIPLASSDLSNLIGRFADVGLSTKDMVVLSGSHTIGLARCVTFRGRIYNETNIDPIFQETRQANCPADAPAGNNNLAPLDVQTPTFFDNAYFVNLLKNKGLLHSDQILFSGVSTDSLVQTYSKNPKAFFADFAAAMIRMGDITPLTGSAGEIRKFCGRPN
ncbi:Peroxidase superfamily protein [Perilla frutescens var. hirtella]|uniref:Peroxidase n=1 Tax=Perilla frutescens var. hirtella TaxID=608512 RepID=A0AAD4JN38_PERFH|nr:Peroxidase superfamily protein [Perilla frutescens var. hirtella]